MKQKILIRIAMTDDTTRAKAMRVAVQFSGVTAAEIKGDHRDQIEVTGNEVDMIALTNMLRKKVAFAELVSVNKVEPPKDGDKKPDEKKPEPCCPPWPYYGYGVPSYYPFYPCDEKKPDEKKADENKPEPCYPPWPPNYGYGVPSQYPYNPCDPCNYIEEPVYNTEPSCSIM